MHNLQDPKSSTQLVVHSDFNCPYCYLEFCRLRKAIELLPEHERPRLWHGPFELFEDTLPAKGVDKYDFLCKLYPKEILDGLLEILRKDFRDLGMELTIRKLGNSHKAHRLQVWADQNLDAMQALALKDQLFRVHSCLGKRMNDEAALLEAASGAGLNIDRSQLKRILCDPKMDARHKKMTKHAQKKLHIATVPCLMVIDDKGKETVLKKATGIDTVEGFSDVLSNIIKQ